MKNILFVIFAFLAFNQVAAQQQARTSIQRNSAPTSESHQSLTFNGAWCWFSDPRAVYYEGAHKRTYAGWVDNYGDIHIGYFDHATLQTHSKVIAEKVEANDHVNPSILFDENGYLLVFFNNHMQGIKHLYMTRSLEPESIDEWAEIKEMHLNDESLIHMGVMNHVYTNPIKLSAENGRIYNFWRGVDGKPSWSHSDDNGHTWEQGEIFFMPEPNYSGGMNIDKENPDIIYLSVNRDSVFEIERWTTRSNGRNWSVEPITQGSTKNNVRPFAVRGAKEGNPIQVLWMQNTKYIHFSDAGTLATLGRPFYDRFHSSIKMDRLSPAIDSGLSGTDIVNIMHRVADWQFANPIWTINELDWHYGAFYTGIRALYEATGAERYKEELINMGDAYGWKPMNDIFHADRLLIIDIWAWLYQMEKRPEMIDKSQWALDIHLARRYERATDVRHANSPYSTEWWTWCDALYMAPPSFVEMWKITGNERYLDYMNRQWWVTSDYLYSDADSLYFRDDRFFDRRSDNGTKIFWSRGNGWVIAGLARMLNNLPEDNQHRNKFVKQYQEMAHKLLSLQGEDGLWRVSLIDPGFLDMGESSGSSFFTYALAWGINNGLIDAQYRPAVEKAWLALTNNVNAEGRLGFVQQVAGDPYPFYEHEWHVYASGAYIMAGSEILKMIGDE